MRRVLLAPGRYIQGPGVLDEIGGLLAGRFKKAFLIGGPRALALVGPGVERQLKAGGAACQSETFGGEASEVEIARLGAAARAAGADVLVTGDVKYHAAMEAEIFTIDVGHFSLEERMTREMAALLDERLGPQGVAVRFFPGSDPLRVHLPR